MITNTIRSAASFVCNHTINVAQFINKNIITRINKIFISIISKSSSAFSNVIFLRSSVKDLNELAGDKIDNQDNLLEPSERFLQNAEIISHRLKRFDHTVQGVKISANVKTSVELHSFFISNLSRRFEIDLTNLKDGTHELLTETTKLVEQTPLEEAKNHSNLITLIDEIQQNLDKLNNILINSDKEVVKLDLDKLGNMKNIYINYKKSHENFLLKCGENDFSLKKLKKLVQYQKSSIVETLSKIEFIKSELQK